MDAAQIEAGGRRLRLGSAERRVVRSGSLAGSKDALADAHAARAASHCRLSFDIASAKPDYLKAPFQDLITGLSI
jgi:hypothetical protein